jgi:20S proteasome alpha/beta subunit
MTSNLLEEKTYKDMPPIVFSGSGRLYSVEAVVAASVSKEDVSANLCVSIVCTDGIVILSTMTKSPHLELNVQDDDDDGIPLLLDEEEELLSIPCSQIAPGLFCATGGNAVESQLLRDKIHQIATSLYERADAGQLVTPSRVSAAMVARQLADHLQRPTQTLSAGSMLAVRVYYS